MLALLDANNFFVSCERLYRPELRGRPVAVLSSNDGCIVSRSNEVKAMGIMTGQPFFQVKGLLEKKGVSVCSGNLVLYQEISQKIMSALGRFSGEIEAYSIDEAFIRLPASAEGNPGAYAARIRETVGQIIGIPLSAGIAPTKTLAKLAAEKAKKAESGVVKISAGNLPGMLDSTAVGDVWGIGRKSAEKLNRQGIYSAGHYAAKDPVWVKKHLTSRGLMTQLELKGQPCFPLVTDPPAPKSIQVSRTWSSVLESFEDVNLAMADNVVEAGRQLRQNKLATGAMSVYVRHGYHRYGQCGYLTRDLYFARPVLSDPELLAAERWLLGKIYQPGYRYTQGGVILSQLTDPGYRRRGLFGEAADERRAKLERFSHAVDRVNERFGERTIYPAALAVKDKKWHPNRKRLSEKRDGFQAQGGTVGAKSR
jgi:DNA polymerase V